MQDCAGGYGAGLAFAAIERLDRGGFGQRVIERVRPAAPLAGLHTYNRVGPVEVVDGFGAMRDKAFTIR